MLAEPLPGTPGMRGSRHRGQQKRPARCAGLSASWQGHCVEMQCTWAGSHLLEFAYIHPAATAVAVAASADRAAATTTAAAATTAATTTLRIGRENGRNDFTGVEARASPGVVHAGDAVADGQDISGLDARLGRPDGGPPGVELLNLLGKLLIGHRIRIRSCQRASDGAVDDARKLFRMNAPGRHEQQYACKGGEGVSAKRRNNPNQSSFHNMSLSWDATVLEDFV